MKKRRKTPKEYSTSSIEIHPQCNDKRPQHYEQYTKYNKENEKLSKTNPQKPRLIQGSPEG